MNHDEAVRVLKLHQQWRMGREPYDKGGCPMPHSPKGLTAALDYAIAYMEPKPTQFDERLNAVNRLYSDNHQNQVNDFLLTLANEMQAHIQKLEKGQSDGSNSDDSRTGK